MWGYPQTPNPLPFGPQTFETLKGRGGVRKRGLKRLRPPPRPANLFPPSPAPTPPPSVPSDDELRITKFGRTKTG